MDQDRVWWTHVVFEGWQERPGPRYQRLAEALLHAVDRRMVVDGARVPAERSLADALGVSRGTVVAAFEHLVGAGVLERRQGAGTFVLGRPPWTSRSDTAVASLLLRRVAATSEAIDLSFSVPAGTSHLPPIGELPLGSTFTGHGLDPFGDATLRSAIAEHLTHHQRLPTTPEQVLVTSGAQQALTLLGRALLSPSTKVIAGCPGYPGFAAAFLGADRELLPVAVDDAGVDPDAVARAAHRRGDLVLYVMPTGHNPTGAISSAARRRALLDVAAQSGITVVEDLALADLVLDPGEPAPAPLAASSDRVVVVGSLSKLMWAGLRIGWIRADPALLERVARWKAADDLATSAPAQAIAVALLEAIDDTWLHAHRRALASRRDHLVQLIGGQLPAWRTRTPAAGLSLWVELPLEHADTFVHAAAAHGVVVAPGSAACSDTRHLAGVRLSFAETLETLELAVERLASAWELHSQDVAATPREPSR
jgi:DNA-binding transcriptional MocR family regulator